MTGRQPRVVIIGAGIVGCATADELARRGWTDVTVLEQGPLFDTGGSSSHAPGLVFQINPSKTMTEFARYTVEKYRGLSLAGRRCFRPVGGLELATTPQRWEELQRRHGLATSWGVESHLRTPQECRELWPLLDVDRLYGGLHIPGDGLADAVRAGEAQARAAMSHGVRFLARRRVTDIEHRAGRVVGVVAGQERFPADVVIVAAGFWGPQIGRLVGLTVPLVPMAHQYARTTPLDVGRAGLRRRNGVPGHANGRGETDRPILRHQDADLYFREHGDRIGVGSYAHRPLPVADEELASSWRPSRSSVDGGERAGQPGDIAAMPSALAFTEDDFAPSWREAVALLPALGEAKVDYGFNGIFSFTPDGFPLLGESRDVRGLWLAEAVWVTHSAGVAKAIAEWLVDGYPVGDVHECDINRFEEVQLAPTYVHERACQNFIEVYDVIHPLQPMESPRPLRTSPFYPRQCTLGAYFLEAAGWERPHWYEANASLLDGVTVPERNDWAARYWSPIAAAEALATRDRVALYDMTPLKRIEVTGPGALEMLQRLTTNNLAKPPGSVTYTLMVGEDGGIRSDLTVARIGEHHFQIGANGNLDLDWLLRHAPGNVQVRDITSGTCCVGVWGPLARELVQPLTDADFSHAGFGYFKVRRAYLGNVPVTAMRVSYVGELGWEIYTTADLGLALWDTLWQAGQRLGVVAGGRSAFNSLRLEKGYRAWGTDMTTEHDPYEAGLGFAVRLDRGDFLGRAALERRAASVTRRLTCLTLDDPRAVVMGREPVYVDGRPSGNVTSAAYGYSVGASIAYAWLPATAAVPGTPVAIEYFGQRLPAVVAAEPLFDPDMAKLRR